MLLHLKKFTIQTANPSIPVYAFCPKYEHNVDGASPKFPVVLFLQALDGNSPLHYIHLIYHIASRGSCVVFSTLDTMLVTHEIRYNQFWDGFSLAVDELSDRIDVSKVGFVGHSFGAGAALSIYKRAREAGWGEDGAFLFLMSPWFVFDMVAEDWPEIPWKTS